MVKNFGACGRLAVRRGRHGMDRPSSTSKVATKIAMIMIEVGEVTCHKGSD